MNKKSDDIDKLFGIEEEDKLKEDKEIAIDINNTPLETILSINLTIFLEKFNITRKNLANFLNVSSGVVGYWTAGKTVISVRNLWKIGKIKRELVYFLLGYVPFPYYKILELEADREKILKKNQ